MKNGSKLRLGLTAAAVVGCFFLSVAAVAQDGGSDSGSGSDVYQRDQNVLDAATELSETLAQRGAESYSDRGGAYDPEDRRDPFLPLVGGAAVEEGQRALLPGISGLLFEELQLVGIVQSEEGDPVAIFYGGPKDEGYFVRQGMNFYNGWVHQISHLTNSVIVRQEVDDPIRPYRDQVIRLYPYEDE